MAIEKKRVLFLLFSILTFYAVAIVNLFNIQFLNQTFYTDLANNQYKTLVKAYPGRGIIYDRNLQPLTLNVDTVSAFIIPKNIKDHEKLDSFLAKYFPNALLKLKELQNDNFMFVKRRLSKDEIELIKSSDVEINLLIEPGRSYKSGSLSSLIGLTDVDNIGIMGMELVYDQYLAGSPSIFSLEKDARSGQFYFEKNIEQQGDEAKNLVTTLDANLSFLVTQELQATCEQFASQKASAIIMNPETGEVLSVCQYPFFDPNDPNSINDLNNKNSAFCEMYEFGSVIKVFMALAAIDEEVVTFDELIDCQNTKSTFIDGMPVNTWKAFGTLSFAEVIQHSNNIGIAKVAKRLGKKLYDHYKKLGFANDSGLVFPGQQKGFITHPKNWSKASILSLSYGYEISCTLLQLVRAFSVIANDGYLVTPKLIKQAEYEKGEKIYKSETIGKIKDVLTKAIECGTSKSAAVKNFKIFGKTGSARLLVDGKYIEHKNIFSFLGCVEHKNYKRVIGVFVKETNRKDIYSSSVAAPLFKRIVTRMLLNDKIFS